MSDGNFNRALLPKNELTAGLRAGKAQMRTRAERAFVKTLEQHMPHLTAQEREQLRESFMQLLRN